MTASEIAVAVLLGLAVVVELLCGLALIVMQTSFDKLHYLGPASLLGPVFVAAAVLVHHSSAQACIKGILLALILGLIGPGLTHATARAMRIRATGNARALPEEMEDAASS